MSETDLSKTIPVAISWLAGKTAVQIQWADGHESTYRAEYLRTICPCAECRETHAAPPLFSQPKKPKKLTMVSASVASKVKKKHTAVRSFPVGNYGIGFEWADGHKDGLYTFQFLREMCPSSASPSEDTAETEFASPG